MPAESPIHWNCPDDEYPKLVGRVRCGFPFLRVNKHTRDPKDATCNRCRLYAEKDGKL